MFKQGSMHLMSLFDLFLFSRLTTMKIVLIFLPFLLALVIGCQGIMLYQF